jgi:hypothetical protein
MIPRVGLFTVFFALILLGLSLLNVHASLYYHQQRFPFLYWMTGYFGLAGVGILRQKKWALLMLFAPGLATAGLFLYVFFTDKRAYVPMPWALVNYAFIALVLGVPAIMLRQWRSLTW